VLSDNTKSSSHNHPAVTAYVAVTVSRFAEPMQSDATMRPALQHAVAAVRDHGAFDRLRRQFTEVTDESGNSDFVAP
jgi:hypothetical protein